MKPQIQYLSDNSVDEVVDQDIRGLLTTCFTKPQDVVFKTQRYFREPYPHRWVIRDEQGALVAHIGVHEKTIKAEGVAYRIGGICEVCVHPDCRGKGYVKFTLERVHVWLSEHGFEFAVLFGDPRVYGSSGYVQVGWLLHGSGKDGWKPVTAMVREVSETSWPDAEVLLPGPRF